jgi:hypothetical protein
MKNIAILSILAFSFQGIFANHSTIEKSQKSQRNFFNNVLTYKKNTPYIKINFATKSISSQIGFSYSIQLPLTAQNTKFLLNLNAKKERFINGFASNQSRFQNIELNADEIISKNNAIFVKWKL